MARLSSSIRNLTSTAVPLARGVSDRLVATARPAVMGTISAVVQRVSPARVRRRHQDTATSSSVPQTFTPAPAAPERRMPLGPAAPAGPTGPTPATIARNVAGARPTAATPAPRRPRTAPGAKLPVRRSGPAPTTG